MMYTRVNILTILFLFSKMNFGSGQAGYILSTGDDLLPPFAFRACNGIIDPEYSTTLCCEEMNYLIKAINKCTGDSPTISTCEQATCVLGLYRALTDNVVDLKKVEQIIVDLDVFNPKLKEINALIKEYCVLDGFNCFPPDDPFCPNWKFLNCLIFSYRIGCRVKYECPVCDKIAEDVATCKPFQKQYVNRLGCGY